MAESSEVKKHMFLDVIGEDQSFEKLLNELGGSQEDFKLNLNKEKDELPKLVKPTPGLCVKTKDENNIKIFINLCHSPEIPKPAHITEKELTDILLSEEPSMYRVPLSLGEPHEEKAKDGSECICYDVIVNTEYFKSIQKDDFFKAFVISVAIEGVEDKYNIKLNRDVQTILQNKRYYGTMPQHFIRRRPIIAEMGSKPSQVLPVAPLKQPAVAEDSIMNPDFLLWRTPATGHPEKITAKVFLPETVTGSSLNIHTNDDRLILKDVNNGYNLDIFLPFTLIPDKVKAEFRLCNKVLVITLPVAPRLD